MRPTILLPFLVLVGCGVGSAPLALDAGGDPDTGAGLDAGVARDAGTAQDAGVPLKPLPRGVYESTAGLRTPSFDVLGDRTPDPLTGVMLKVPWDLCAQDCLLDAIQSQLDGAEARGLKVALIVLDAFSAPADVLARCARFEYAFRGEPKQMCLPWDEAYLAAKGDLLSALGARFDAHPALAYVYFTGACSTNGAEGHCRVDEAAFTAAGYSEARLAEAYLRIMRMQQAAFPRTPIAFEVHAIFGGAEPWASLWDEVKDGGRVGVAAWWCAERLSLFGDDITPVWGLVQAAAEGSFSVCQTVGNFSSQPYRFSNLSEGFDYGTEADWDAADVARAFAETLDWAEGRASHGGQGPIAPFSVLEPWSQDVVNPAFEARLRAW